MNSHFNLLKRVANKILKRKVLTVLKALPPSIQIEITTRCNLHCPYCPRTALDTAYLNKDMDIELFRKIISSASNLDSVRLFGIGEPFMHPRFFEMVEIAKKESIKVIFHTDGILLNEKLVEEILDYNIDKIIFSIDGASEEVYKKIRPESNFKKVTDNIKLLDARRKERKESLKLSICFTCYRDNVEDIPAIVDYANEVGIEEIHYQNMIPWTKSSNSHSVFSMEEGFLERKFALAPKRAKILGINISRIPNCRFEEGNKYILCPKPWEDLYIRVDGLAVACDCFTYKTTCQWRFEQGRLENRNWEVFPYIIGNINDSTLEEMWNGKEMIRLRRALLKGEPPEPCNHCFLLYRFH